MAKIDRARPRIRGFYPPLTGDSQVAYPCQFPMSGDTRYERLAARLHGKAADELAFAYSICA